jgi:opacity protein-like surface antigen
MSRYRSQSRPHVFGRTLSSALLGSIASLSLSAHAANPIGLYAGGAIGQANLEANVPTFSTTTFKDNHSAYKLLVGVRPISLLGVEISYIDFGHANGTLQGYQLADLDLKGTAAFGVLYLPVPVIDLYLKAGVSSLRSQFNGTALVPGVCQTNVPNCNVVHQNQTDAGFAAGAGVQVKFGSLAARADFERFTAVGAHPNMISLGLIWKF